MLEHSCIKTWEAVRPRNDFLRGQDSFWESMPEDSYIPSRETLSARNNSLSGGNSVHNFMLGDSCIDLLDIDAPDRRCLLYEVHLCSLGR